MNSNSLVESRPTCEGDDTWIPSSMAGGSFRLRCSSIIPFGPSSTSSQATRQKQDITNEAIYLIGFCQYYTVTLPTRSLCTILREIWYGPVDSGTDSL